MNFVILGTTEFTLCCAQAVIDSGQNISGLISLPSNKLPLNSTDIHQYAGKHKIPYYEIDDVNSDDAIKLIKNLKPDFILSSWPKILKKNILNIPTRYCIGSHPTVLPFNRGRHPLHWMITLGITDTAVSFFKIDENIDNGNILLQIPFSIDGNDCIADAVEKMNQTAYQGLSDLIKRLTDDQSYDGEVQEEIKANYWRKRSIHDTIIDFRITAKHIIQMVRSYTTPYPCAKLIFEDYMLDILDVQIDHAQMTYGELKRIEPGKIIAVGQKYICVKASDEIVRLIFKKNLPEGMATSAYIHPPTKYISNWKEKLIVTNGLRE